MTVVPLRRNSGREQLIQQDGIVAALDVGSTKITCLIAQIKNRKAKPGQAAGEEIHIIGVGHQAARGVRGGVVVNLDEAERAIRLAVDQAERMAGREIHDVLVNVSGGRPQSRVFSATVPVSQDVVSQGDIDLAVIHAARNIDAGRRVVLHAAPVQFHVDDARGVSDPIGLFGEKLSIDLAAVLVEPAAMRNLSLVIERCHLNISGMVISPYAAGRAALVEDEINLGTTLIEMGGATTGVAVFNNGHLCFAETIPIGGEHITRDLAHCLSTPLAHAERLKTLYGNSMISPCDDGDVVSVPILGERGVDSLNHVPRSYLTQIIRPRLEEIFELVQQRLAISPLTAAAGQRVVLSGGASQLVGLRETASHILRRPVRISQPSGVETLPDSATNSSFSLAIGLLRYALKPDQRNVLMARDVAGQMNDRGYVGRMGRWIKESF